MIQRREELFVPRSGAVRCCERTVSIYEWQVFSSLVKSKSLSSVQESNSEESPSSFYHVPFQYTSDKVF
eukprot:g45890.t1